MNDAAVVAALAGTFALAITAHLATLYGLLLRPPRWRAAVALVFPPAGVYWAWREKMYVRSVALVIAVLGYIVARVLASRLTPHGPRR